MNEDKLRQQLAEAAQAQALLENKFLWELFDKMSAEYIAAWKTRPVDDTAGRERLWMAVNVCAKVMDNLNKMVSNGKMAKADLERMAQG